MNIELTMGKRWIAISYGFLIAVPVALIFLAFWQTWVDTSPTLSDAERLRGWGIVVRELPATLLLVALPIFGLFCAVKAGRYGARSSASRAVLIHGVAMFFVLLVVMNGSAENIMTTRPATVKWLLFPLQIACGVMSVFISRKAIAHKLRPGITQ